MKLYARGRLKFKREELLTGDFVEVEKDAITCVYPRKTRFSRPNIANLECLVIFISDYPSPDYLILDKLILSACYADIECAIVVNKSDLGDCTYKYVLSEYPFIKNVFHVSSLSGAGINKLAEFVSGKSVAFAGQSAVGKTSVINALTGNDFLTGGLSEKTERGKHTTTYSRIIRTENFSVYDTPGFSELCVDITPCDAAANFPPFDAYLGKCKFVDCLHADEPGCEVKKAVDEGVIPRDRYERYKTIAKEIYLEYKNKYGKQ